MTYEVVIPTAGRDSLSALLRALAAGTGPPPERVIVVDDRRAPDGPLAPTGGAAPVEVLRGPGRGPAAARNAGWRRARAEWVAFLDDDVLPAPDWRGDLAGELASLGDRVAATQGRIVVPPPAGRRPTDWERNTAGLERARWATADMCFRRTALADVGGFDERFERAYREDADLGLRLAGAGWELARGRRAVLHPPRPARPSVSLRLQAGNADDVLMRALHGRDWRERAGAPRGRLRRHLAIVAAAVAAVGALAAGRRRVATLAGAAWLAGTAELAWARIAPGPHTPAEVATMLWTSALIPPTAAYHRARGYARLPGLLRGGLRGSGSAARADAAAPPGGPRAARRPPGPGPTARAAPVAVLLDRDGTLIEDVPYNGDPERVRPMPGAREALDRLRAAGVRLAVVSNQSGVGRGLIASEDVGAVNRRVEQLLGPLGPWLVCPHGPADGCECRKPRPGLILRAASGLGVDPEGCALIGDIGADMEAAQAAGTRAVMVPTARTRAEEMRAAPVVASSLLEAVDLLLEERA